VRDAGGDVDTSAKGPGRISKLMIGLILPGSLTRSASKSSKRYPATAPAVFRKALS